MQVPTVFRRDLCILWSYVHLILIHVLSIFVCLFTSLFIHLIISLLFINQDSSRGRGAGHDIKKEASSNKEEVPIRQ